MDEDINPDLADDLDLSEEPKVCSECEREFEGEGDMCPECTAEEGEEDME